MLHRGGFADNPFKRIVSRLLIAQPRQFAFKRIHHVRPAQNDFQLFQLHRLVLKIVRARFDGFQRRAFFLIAGNDNHLDSWIDAQQFIERLQPFRRAVGIRRQPQIQRHHAGQMLLTDRHRRRAIFRKKHLVLFRKPPFHLFANIRIIINNKDFSFFFLFHKHPTTAYAEGESGSSMRNSVPRPISLSTNILPPCASTIVLL